MNLELRKDADQIVAEAIRAVQPDAAVIRALEGKKFPGRVYVVAAGKAAYQMAKVASEIVDFEDGVVVTKYDHVLSPIPGVACYEAGHPVPDENGFKGTRHALKMTENLKAEDTVLFLLSGGGSALFEDPLVSGEELADITGQLLKSGAEITEINTIRKRLSKVKGGKFAQHVAPAQVYSVILSDIIGDPMDMIASGPAVPDSSSCEEALQIVEKYKLKISDEVKALLQVETPKQVENVENRIIGSVKELCQAAKQSAENLGYRVTYLTDQLTCEAREAGNLLGSIARSHGMNRAAGTEKIAFVLGGETVVHLQGNGLGGRNQEVAVGAMAKIADLSNVAVFSVGSDGTDGPTDAAGGYVDGDSLREALEKELSPAQMQADNDCYHLLQAIGGLIKTGPTGTNVNDFSMVLIG